MFMNLRMDKGRGRRLTFLLLAGCLLGWASGVRAQTAESDVRRDATVAAVEKVMPTVVNIATESRECGSATIATA